MDEYHKGTTEKYGTENERAYEVDKQFRQYVDHVRQQYGERR